MYASLCVAGCICLCIYCYLVFVHHVKRWTTAITVVFTVVAVVSQKKETTTGAPLSAVHPFIHPHIHTSITSKPSIPTRRKNNCILVRVILVSCDGCARH